MSSDGMDEVFEGQLRVWLATVGQLAEYRAQMRETELRRAEARSAHEAREFQARLEAERRAAHAAFTNVYRDSWWDRVTESQLHHMWETARTWSGEDPEAARAEMRMREELEARWGITREHLDADELKAHIDATEERLHDAQTRGDDPEVVQDKQPQAPKELREAETLTTALEEEQRATAATLASRDGQARSGAEKAEAHRLLEQADHDVVWAKDIRDAADHAPEMDEEEHIQRVAAAEQTLREAAHTEQVGRQMWDSAERREATAADLRARGIDAKVVAARMRADISQAKPATEAVKTSTVARTPQAQAARGRVAQVQRTGLNR